MVLIRGMFKPDSCSNCRIADHTWMECKVAHKKIGAYVDNVELPAWCPLVEVVAYGPEGTLYKEK